jgi:hypothetical protein
MQTELNCQLAATVCGISETRDRSIVHRAFQAMSPQARRFLWNWLEIDSRFGQGEIPEATSATGQDFLWRELVQAANSNGRTFYIVEESRSNGSDQIFVSSDLASANNFARNRTEQRLRPTAQQSRVF